MPIKFKLSQRLAGFAATSAKEGEKVSLLYRELLGPDDSNLNSRLEELHSCLFSKIEELPKPPKIADLVVVIDQELNGTAYVDELPLVAKAIPDKPFEKGQEVRVSDISEIHSIEMGCQVNNTDAVVIVRSVNWKRSLFFDFGPFLEDDVPRTYDLNRAMGQQMTLLYGLPLVDAKIRVGELRLQVMKEALERLDSLLEERCTSESEYQQLLDSAPWMLGNSYCDLVRHQKMDDANIPDFTALRAYDFCHDVVELKQPFLKLFRQDGSFSVSFSDAWHQAERYLDFCQRQRTYLYERKQLKFENPRCILLIGENFTSEQADAIRAKESLNRLITVMSYEQLRQNALHVFNAIASVDDRLYAGKEIRTIEAE